MTSRILIIAALAATIAAGLYLFLGGESSVSTNSTGATAAPGVAPASSSRVSENGAMLGTPTSSTEATRTAVNWKRFTAMTAGPDGSGEAMPKPTPEDIARFLAKHGETAVNLVAAFGVDRDRRWLDRALELFPNSPIVLMAAIEAVPSSDAPKPGEKSQPDAERLALIERFKAADPKNPLAWIFSAQELFKAGQAAEAVADIRAALERPAFYIYANERMDGAQRLYEDLGLNPVEAGAIARAGLTLPHMGAAHQASRSLMEWQKSAAESGDTAAAEDALHLTYDLGRTFATPEASRTLIGQLVGISMEKRAIEALPAGAQPAWLAVAPAQRLAEMERQRQDVRDLTAAADWLYRSRDEQLFAEYLRRNRSDGELSALTWLKTQRK